MLQVKLLRVLQEREIMRVGGNRIINIDVRIVAATNEALERKVEEGSFRRDLYYRLNTLPIVIPPLAARGDDMFLLINHFREELGGEFSLTSPVKEFLKNYSWPGNIRELRNVVEYFIYTGHRQIGMEDLPPTLLKSGYPRLRPVLAQTQPERQPAYENLQPSGRLDKGEDKTYWFILEQLYKASEQRTSLGRDKILEKARESYIPMSQQEVRNILTKMAEDGIAKVSRGRGGSQLTPKGRNLWEEHLPGGGE